VFASIICLTAGAQVKTIRGWVEVPTDKYLVEVLNRGMVAKVDKDGFFVLQNVTDDDLLIFYRRGDRPRSQRSTVTVAQVKHTVLSQHETPFGSPELTINRDTAGVAFLSDNADSNTAFYYDRNVPEIKIGKIKQYAKGNFKIQDANTFYKFDMRYTGFTDFATVANLPKLAENQNNYSPYDFFRTGISFGNTLDLKLPTFSEGTTSVGLGQKRMNSPIPNADFTSYNANLSMNELQWGYFKTDAGAMFRSSNARLAKHGANLASLQQAALTYPATPEKPLDLAKSLPDNDRQNMLNAYVKTKYNRKALTANASLNYGLENSKRNSKSIFDDNQLSFRRNEQMSNILANTFWNYALKTLYSEVEWNFYSSYVFNHISDKLSSESVNAPVYTNRGKLTTPFDKKLTRNTHNVRYGANFRYGDYSNNLCLELNNQHYFSNTLNSYNYINLFPEFGFLWNNESFFGEVFSWDGTNFKLRGKIGRNVGETDLFYRNYAALSTNFSAQNFRFVNENADISSLGLKPEIYVNREIGFELKNDHYYRHRYFNFEFNYFDNITNDLISSYFNNNIFTINNIAALRNYGFYSSVIYGKNHYNTDFNYSFQFNFSKIRSVVTDLYAEEPFVRIGGFSDVAVVAAKGETLGAIYGKTYQRELNGDILTDATGNPLINNDLKKIGDPTPDAVLSLVTDLDFSKKKLNLSFTMQYSIGGDRLNGTRAALENYGVSGETIVGKFSNSWQTGVFEDYIESATYFSIPDISVSYYFIKDNQKTWFRNVKLMASVKNLVLVTAYKGVSPASLLFGYPSAAGLDFFNQAHTRNYTLSLIVDL
jgi:hypothetical protein